MDLERSRPQDFTWLARRLMRGTSEVMKETGDWEQVEKDLSCNLVDVDVIHKWNPKDFGSEFDPVRLPNSGTLVCEYE